MPKSIPSNKSMFLLFVKHYNGGFTIVQARADTPKQAYDQFFDTIQHALTPEQVQETEVIGMATGLLHLVDMDSDEPPVPIPKGLGHEYLLDLIALDADLDGEPTTVICENNATSEGPVVLEPMFVALTSKLREMELVYKHHEPAN